MRKLIRNQVCLNRFNNEKEKTMDDESKKLSIEFLEKWAGRFSLYFALDPKGPNVTYEEHKELVAGLKFILHALKGDMQIIHNPK